MTPSAIEDAARLLADARRQGQRLAGLPENLRPASVDEAHAVQDAVRRLLGETPGAAKVNTPAVGGVVRGIVPADLTMPSGAWVTAAAIGLAGIEAEIGFVFPRGLEASPEGYDASVVAAAAEAFAAFDVVGTRFHDFMARSQLERVADALNAGAFVYGPARRDWREIDFAAIGLRVEADGAEVFRGQGGHAAGDPFLPVVRYLETVCETGLEPGAMITTGSFCGLLAAAPGQRFCAEFDDFAPVEVRLVPP